MERHASILHVLLPPFLSFSFHLRLLFTCFFSFHYLYISFSASRNRDSSVGTVTSAGRPRNIGSITSRGKTYFSWPILRAHTCFYPMFTRIFFSRG
jgi:hypothetical protein